MSIDEQHPNRISTGVAGLDTLLGGGLVAGGVYLVMGRPGTGKTTLGNQACFSHVRGGERAAYVTLLAETHARMLRNLTSMAFFDAEAIGTSISFVGAYTTLRERKLNGLLALLRRVMADHKPSLLVLDGLTAAQALGEGDAHLKEFVAELQVLSDMSRCTTLILANMSANQAAHAEHSMVDGLIELTLDRGANRAIRAVEILKFRGGDHFLGTHDMEISTNGLTVRPRTEELLSRMMSQPPAPTLMRRVSTGIPNLDTMLGGGVLGSSATMLLGFSGSGKTMLTLHFLDAGAAKQEPVLYFGFYESPERLVECGEAVGLPLRQHLESGLLSIHWQPALRYSLDALAEHIIHDVRARNVRRVVIDGIDGFRQAAAHPERTIRFLTALANELRALDVTTMITEETQKIFGPEVEVRISGISALVDNIVLLEYLDLGGELKRLLSVVKQRGSGHDGNVRELRIGESGIQIAADPVSASEILKASFGEGRTRRSRGS